MNHFSFFRRDKLVSREIGSGVLFLANGNVGVAEVEGYPGKISFEKSQSVANASIRVWDDGVSFTVLLPIHPHGEGNPGCLRFTLKDETSFSLYLSWTDIVSTVGGHQRIEWSLHKDI